MLESIKIICSETLEIYSLATLGGKLFIPFFLCLVWLLFTDSPEDDKARRYLVYPSLVLMFIIFNPVFIHILYKFIAVPERIVRMYWPLPMDIVFVYCLIRLFSAVKKSWKKALLLCFAMALLLVNAGGSTTGQSYGKASNPEKMPLGTKEVCDTLFVLNDYTPAKIISTDDLFFWTRVYSPYVLHPCARYIHWLENEQGQLELDSVAQYATEYDCDFIVLNSSQSTVGSLEDCGFEIAASIPGQDCFYVIYKAG